jgi:hypothetical protein
MSISDIINPWGALRRLHQRYVDVCGELRIVERKLLELDAEAREARLRAGIAKVDISRLRADVARLEATLMEGHFRNPKTGRLGRKGELFQ